jgi:hypothetical protein
MALPLKAPGGAASGAMSRGGKACWKAIRVYGPHGPGGAHGLRELGATERLVALYRFHSGERPTDHRFLLEGGREPDLTDAAAVDWEAFPMLAALEAVSCDELGRLRRLLRTDWIAASPVPPAPASRPIADEPARWGFDLVPDTSGPPRTRSRSRDL